MRESIGGTMLFWIVLFFMSIFITFLAAVIQYAKVYKIKNSTINYLERGEGVASKIEFEQTLKQLGYFQKGKYEICRYSTENRGGYYSIKLYAIFEIMTFSLEIPIKGETKLIETGVLINSESNNWFNETDFEKQCYNGTLS